MRNLFFLLIALVLVTGLASAQTTYRFYDDVQTIKKYDKIYKPTENPVLFIGSSSIRKWDDAERVFAPFNVLNRGIGGAVTDDITHYLNDIVFPYKPRQIVLYVGENDLPSANVTADSVLNKTIRLYDAIRAVLPAVPIVYISMKPSPSREKYVQKAIDANQLIKAYMAKQKNTVFVDIFPLMLTEDGKNRPELFVSDMLHMNKAGYAIWEKAVKPHLLKY